MHLEAARKDSAVHVSLSSDSLFKQPGAWQLHPRKPGKNSGEAIKLPTTDRKLCHLFKSAMLRKARRHARAVRRASEGVYIRATISCQHDYSEKFQVSLQPLPFSTNGVEPLILQAI
jgi:hypothetical protein